MSSSDARLCARPACAKQLPPPKPSGRTRKYCDDTCRSGARRDRAGEAPALASGPFPIALRDAISHSGVPLRTLSEHLADAGRYLTPSTLSHWQQGHTAPRRTIETRHNLLALERLLGLPAAQLISALEGGRKLSAGTQTRSTAGRGSGPRQQLAWARLEDQRRQLEARLASQHGVCRADLALIRQQEHYRVGLNHRPVSSLLELTACALGGQIGSYWYIYRWEPSADTIITPVSGCRRGRQLEQPPPRGDADAKRFRAVELCFDPERRLGPGEAHTFVFKLDYPDADSNDLTIPLAEREFYRHLPTPACRQLDLSIRFDCSNRPINLTRTRSYFLPDRPTESTPATLTGRQDEVHETNPMPGVYGWRWDWSGADQVAPPVDE
jgi:hypothetical protein